MRQSILSLWVVLLILVILHNSSSAQEKGRVGLTVKNQLIPRVGISYGISDKIQTRLSTYMDFNEGELISSTISNLGFLIRLSSDKSLSTYIGPDVTYNGFDNDICLGFIAGIEYILHPRLNLFAEIGPSISTEYGNFSFINTGIGIKYYFK